MSTNPNEIERYSLSTEQLDALFERSREQAAADRVARQRAAEWPTNVDQMLATLARELVALRERVDAVEAAARRG